MTINAVGTTGSLLSLNAASSVQNALASALQDVNGASGSQDTTTVSPMSSLMNKLEQLKNSDPDKFKQLMTDAASKLSAAAKNQTDTKASQFLSSMADKFQQVANSADISTLFPSNSSANAQNGAQKAYGHHHHHQQQQTTSDLLQNVSTATSTTGTSTAQTNSGDSVRDVMGSIFSELNQALTSLS